MLTGKATVNAITFQRLSTLLIAGGLDVPAFGASMTQDGYLKNADTAIVLYVGTSSTNIAPTTNYITVQPTDNIPILAGANLNEVWVKCASSTITVDFAEGALYESATINGVIGEITATENQIPKADAAGNLVASSLSDDTATVTTALDLDIGGDGSFGGALDVTGNTTLGGTVGTTGVLTATGAIVVTGGVAASGNSAHDFSGSSGTFKTSTGANSLSGAVTVTAGTTPSITTQAGSSNTGFVQINGKTSGSTKIITADSTAQAVVISTAAQTTGGSTLTIPDQAGASSSFVFTTLAQALSAKTVSLSAGTTAVPAVKFASGQNLTVATAGALEYDGVVFYGTPTAGARALNVNRQFSIVPAGDFSLATTSGVQSAFPTTGDVWTLDATTAYFFKGVYYITHTTSTCTVGLAFPTSGSVTSIGYKVNSVIQAAGNGAPAAPVTTYVNQITSTVVTATSTDGWMIEFEGILRMNGAGTITPQINFSGNTTAPVMKVNSWIQFEALGTNTQNVLGAVA